VGRGFNSQPYNTNVQDLSATKYISLLKEFSTGIATGPYFDYKQIQINNMESLNGQSVLGMDCTIGLRGNIHYVKLKRFHLYTGGMIGMRILALDKNDSEAPAHSILERYEVVSRKIETDLYTGASFYFTNWIGGFVEIGRGKNLVGAGLSLKF